MWNKHFLINTNLINRGVLYISHLFNLNSPYTIMSCLQDTLSSRARLALTECAREQRYLAYNIMSYSEFCNSCAVELHTQGYFSQRDYTMNRWAIKEYM